MDYPGAPGESSTFAFDSTSDEKLRIRLGLRTHKLFPEHVVSKGFLENNLQ